MADLSGTMKAARGLRALLIAVVLASTAAIVATYSQLSHTWDEGAHVSAGLEFLQDGRYTDTENPPVSRVALALIPYLRGARLLPEEQRSDPGFTSESVFYRSPQYVRNVTEARLANLFFFWACVVLTWLLAGGKNDPWVAFLASAAVATLPSIVGHSGLANTDVAFVASFLLALLAVRNAVLHPNIRTATLLGAAAGIAVATKFSTFVFLPPVMAAILACHYWPQRRQWLSTFAHATTWRMVGAGSATAILVVWACYGFHVGRLSDLPAQFGGRTAAIRDWLIPGHEFINGLQVLKVHVIEGEIVTLFDEFSARGFVLYFPVMLLTKTPLPFLAFAGLGLWGLCIRREDERWRWFLGLALGALGVLLVALNSTINMGIRHVLVIYPLVALPAAYGLVRWAEGLRVPDRILAIGGGLLTAQMILLISSVPNQISYFNVLPGSDPGHISSASELDWGQDALAFERYFDSHPVPELYVQLNGTTRTCWHRHPPLKGLPLHPVSGWIAISERVYRLNRGSVRKDPCALANDPENYVIAPPGWLDWLKGHEPVDIIGKSIRLYQISDADIAPSGGQSSQKDTDRSAVQ